MTSAKKSFKAILLDNEGISAKVATVMDGINDEAGTNKDNIAYNLVDEITREDIAKLAKKIFKNPPRYFIVASDDTLKANAEYLKNLKTT